MLRILLLIFIVQILISPLQSQGEESLGTANYDIQVTLDPASKTLSAKEQIIFINPSSDTIWDLKFHLYYNAFKNTNSTFLSGSGNLANFLNTKDSDGCPFSFTKILQLSDQNNNDLTQKISYFTGPFSSQEDETVLNVDLIEPILPFDTIRLDMDWEAKIPRIMPRTGTNKDFYFFAQWFPKLGVYEPAGVRYSTEGNWNCHPYFSSGEFYADFGNYKVDITVPADFVVGSSGNLASKTIHGDMQTWRFELNNVIDFAWTTSPHFIQQEQKYGDVTINLLSYPDHEHCATKYFGSIRNAMEYLEKHVGAYPYSTISVIDVPIHGLFTGGMEYPTFISSMSFCFLPVGVKTTQTLTIHEFIHQYFMQIVASNETEEPWMDEGITSYYEGRIVDHYYGGSSALIDWMGAKIGNTAFNRWEYFSSRNISIADNTYKSWEFKDGGYKMISYNKTAIWLETLEHLIGLELMDKIMQQYFEQWKFKHPCGKDFEAIVNEMVIDQYGDKFGTNMDWFFDQVLRGSGQCDYAVAKINNNKNRLVFGYEKGSNDCIPMGKEHTNEPVIYQSEVIFERLEDLYFPQDIEVILENGEILTEVWDGKSRTFNFQYSGPDRIIGARIDPNNKIQIDRNFLNNSKVIKVDQKGIRYYFTRFLQTLQNSMETIAWLA